MSIQALRDPEGAELAHLVAAYPFAGKKVVEIGCGNGCLTWQYADLPGQVVAIDPKISDLHAANGARATPLRNVTFTQAIGEALPFPDRIFDLALFSSSF